jgi:3-phytase
MATPVPPTATAVPLVVKTATFNPVADTYTSSSAPSSTAGGTALTLRADVSGTDTAYLRFDLSSLAGKTITSISLKLHSSTESWAGSGATFDIHQVGSTDWKEQYMSYTNTVPISTTVLGSLAAPANPNTWYTATLSPSAVQPRMGSLISMAVTGRTGDVLIFNSREAGGSLAPQLVVTYQ